MVVVWEGWGKDGKGHDKMGLKGKLIAQVQSVGVFRGRWGCDFALTFESKRSMSHTLRFKKHNRGEELLKILTLRILT